MAIALTPELERLVQEKLTSGKYESQEDVLRAALQALDEQEEIVSGIQEGYDDLQAGRYKTLEEADAQFRSKHDISRDA